MDLLFFTLDQKKKKKIIMDEMFYQSKNSSGKTLLRSLTDAESIDSPINTNKGHKERISQRVIHTDKKKIVKSKAGVEEWKAEKRDATFMTG